jgi:hypothetical protein
VRLLYITRRAPPSLVLAPQLRSFETKNQISHGREIRLTGVSHEPDTTRVSCAVNAKPEHSQAGASSEGIHLSDLDIAGLERTRILPHRSHCRQESPCIRLLKGRGVGLSKSSLIPSFRVVKPYKPEVLSEALISKISNRMIVFGRQKDELQTLDTRDCHV